MDGFRRRWWLWLIVTALFGLAIVVLAPKYGDVQRAADVGAFRLASGDAGRGRTAGAAGADIFFAISYALLALALTRQHVATRIGAGLVAFGAAVDLVENGLVLRAVAQIDDITDGFVDTIRAVGVVKYATAFTGVVVLAVGLVLDRRARPESA